MPRTYTCILIDDELLALAYLRTMCEEIPGIEVVKVYNQPELLLEELSRLQFDFCISDIVMPGINGLELSQHLNGRPVIFTTAHNEFAADAYDLDAIDYVRKPVQKQRLEKAIEKTIQLLESQTVKPVSIKLNTDKGKLVISSEDIIAISSETIDKRDKLMTLTSGERRVLKNISFDELLQLLPEQQFCRISKAEIIAIRIVSGYSGDQIFTSLIDKSGESRSFILGDNYRKVFLQRLA